MELDRIVQPFRALSGHEVESVFVGGAAVDLHGRVRNTFEIEEADVDRASWPCRMWPRIEES